MQGAIDPKYLKRYDCREVENLQAENLKLKAVAKQARNYILFKEGTAPIVVDNIEQALNLKSERKEK